jgi:hypothetical protein
MSAIPDVRRHVALRAYGAVRMLDWVQAAVEDVEGAIADGQYGVAAFQARWAVLQCLSIRSLARGGEIESDAASLSFDFFAGLTPDEIAEGLSLAARAVDLDDGDADAWLEQLQSYVSETENVLGYATPLPVLRSKRGPFGLVALARAWMPVLDELGLPSLLLPPEWLSSDG